MRELAALLVANGRYWTEVSPRVRRELRWCERRARAIPNPALRAVALANLRDERFNAEVAATLATFAPRRHRASVVTATVSFQVMYDYLDSVGEEERADDPLRDGLQLFRAFDVALTPGLAPVDYYRHHPERDDGGYLDALAARCGGAFRLLPAAAVVAPYAQRAARRCGEAQSRTHAIPRDGVGQLAAWSHAQTAGSGLAWWELAAGACAGSLSVHALVGAAADPRTTASDAAGIEAAYVPICALSTLLDSLVDRERDAADGSHAYVAYYPSATAAANGIVAVAARAATAARRLPHGAYHAVIATGVAGFYTSAPAARCGSARAVTARVVGELRPLITPILAIFRMWRAAKGARRLVRR